LRGVWFLLFFAQALVENFSGKGIVPESLLGTPELLLTVGIGTALTIFIATLIGMPTSTTHALTGSLTGVAVVSAAGAFPWQTLSEKFLLPLIISPFIAIVLSIVVYSIFHRTRKGLGISRNTCVCLQDGCVEPVQIQADGSMVMNASGAAVVMDEVENCIQSYDGSFVGIEAQKPVDIMHYISGGAVCFSRAVNDTPKIAALLLAAPAAFSTHFVLGLVAAAMALGGWLNAKKVAETMSKQITDLSPGQGLSANLSTAALVLFASKLGIPVSTTHVSCGAIFGIAAANRSAKWKTITRILSVWLTTFPFAALLSGLLFFLIS